MLEQVVLWKCGDYDPELLQEALKRCFTLLGGLDKFVRSGQTVFLKLNLLMKKKPEDAVTTHPAVVEAMVRLLQERGATVIIGDSPGGPYNQMALKAVYRTAGIEEVARKTGATLNFNTQEIDVPYPEGKIIKRFTLIKPLVDADIYISLSKLKTHMMTKFTGAVKVNFGAIPGMLKAEYHFKMPRVMDFSEMLLDLTECLKPTLNIMDAIVGMEGKGPSAGTPKKVGALLVSTSAPALDVVAAALAGIEPVSIPTVKAAENRGLPASINQVELMGYKLTDFNVQPFALPDYTGEARFPIPDLLNRFLESWLKPRPVFMEDQCIFCRECINNCPPKALSAGNKAPEIDLNKCIRCFCCQELCPRKAVDIKKSPLARLLFK